MATRAEALALIATDPTFYVEARVGSANHRNYGGNQPCRAVWDGGARNEPADEVIRVLAAMVAAQAPQPNPAGEELAAKFRAESRAADGKPDGTRAALERCARMLDTYAPDCFPANEHGQIHFARAMMESVADEIRAFLAATA